MVHFMGDAEGELAFIMSHEIGHTVDDQCKTQAGRAQIGQAAAPMRSFFGALLGGGNGAAAATQLATQRSCEARADAVGFYIFTASGYNPFDAAGAFGRLEMYLGDTSTGVFARLAAMGSNHPMTPDRIRHMRALLINYEQEHAAR
jgi:predicted Zn-dependent protease